MMDQVGSNENVRHDIAGPEIANHIFSVAN